MITVSVKTSASGPFQEWGFAYRPSHPPLRNGRVVSYWVGAAVQDDPVSGVAIIIRKAP